MPLSYEESLARYVARERWDDESRWLEVTEPDIEVGNGYYDVAECSIYWHYFDKQGRCLTGELSVYDVGTVVRAVMEISQAGDAGCEGLTASWLQ